MQAVWIEEYGGPEVLRFGDRPVPPMGPRDVTVAVKAASVNPIDWKLREGVLRDTFPLRMPSILGRDLSGIVTAVGQEVTSLKPGDEVFGVADALRQGTHADTIVTDCDLLAPKPRSINFVEAASLPLAGATALIALEDVGGIAANERVLIHGGAGGVGGFAVQLAKHRGAWVAATCSGANRDYVLGLGADRAIDRSREDFATLLDGLDLVFDTVGGTVHQRSLTVLKPEGRLVYIIADPIPSGDAAPPRRVLRANIRGNRGIFERIAALVDDGAVRPQISAVLPLRDAARAYEMSRAGGIRGKIVLEVAS